jgi:hypothetical protein
MALKKCKECGNEVSSSAKVCPKCGKKLKMGLIKKTLIGLGVLILLGAISSQMKGGSGSTESTKVGTKQATEEVAGKIGENIEIGNFIYSIDQPKFKKTVGNEFSAQTADGIYLLIPIAIKNIGNEEHTLDGTMFKLTDANGTEYSHSTQGSTALMMAGSKTIFFKQCQPNIVTSGILIFEVPDKTSKYTLKVSGGFWSGKTASISLN